jgi:iron-sulfur cluster repair protein YtfE (RIC family)
MQDFTGTIDANSIVNDTLQIHPGTTGVFNAFGIDACCGGAASIAEAAQRDNADVTELLAALNAAAAQDPDARGKA